MPRSELVLVTLVDAQSGQELARTEYAAAQLPDSFDTATRLDMDGASWTVVRADPPTAAEFVTGGSLVLMLNRLTYADPQEIKYSLPTFFDPLPPTEPVTSLEGHFMLHEDDWRQVELTAREVMVEVDTELRAIQQIRRDHSRVVGAGASSVRIFERLHIRRAPSTPLPGGLPQRRLFELLPAATKSNVGMNGGGGPARLVDSFAAAFGPLTVYGRTDGDRVVELCLAGSLGDFLPPDTTAKSVQGLGRLMSEFDLVLVDWCAGRRLDAADLAAWLAKPRDRRTP